MSGLDANTVLLVHFNGKAFAISGAAFIDSSDSGHNTGGGVIGAPGAFGQTSVEFDGTIRFSTGDSIDWDFGTGDFVIDMWLKPTAANTSDQWIIGQFDDTNNYWIIRIDTTLSPAEMTAIQFIVVVNGTTIIDVDVTGLSQSLASFHIALQRSANNFDIWINGVNKITVSDTSLMPNLTSNLTAAGPESGAFQKYTGRLDELRIIKGTTAYTSGVNFTTATKPYTDSSQTISSIDSNTVLMIHGVGGNGKINGSGFVESATKKTVTNSGVTVNNTINNINKTSLLFVQSGSDSFSLADSDDWNFGTGDFTVEANLRFVTDAASQILMEQRTDVNNFQQIKFNNLLTDINYTVFSGGSTVINLNATFVRIFPDQWNHFAIVRSGNEFSMFLNGLLIRRRIDASGVADLTGAMFWGSDGAGANFLDARVEEIRVTKGVALYTRDFDVPTTPFVSAQTGTIPVDSSFKLLIHGDGPDASSTFFDSSPSGHTVVAQPGTEVDTAFPAFGTGGAKSNSASATGLDVADSAEFDFGTGDFSIDFRVRRDTTAGGAEVWYLHGAVGDRITIEYKNDASPPTITFIVDIASSTITTVTADLEQFASDTYNHVAFVRDGNNLYIFIDGIMADHVDVTGDNYTGFSGVLQLKCDPGSLIDGWIDEIRITDDAKWTLDFALPTTAYTHADPTIVSVTPNSGLALGGESVVIAGTNFVIGVTIVTFDGILADNIVVDSAIQITCDTPVHAAGAVDVVVDNGGTPATLVNGYTYFDPAVTSVTDATGPTVGGKSVVVAGTNFDTGGGGVQVEFDGVDATSIVVDSAIQITCTIPAHAIGPVDVVVKNSESSFGTLSNGFAYVNPTVTSIAPFSGLPIGSTSVTIKGTTFSDFGTNDVTFDGLSATSIVVVDEQTITCDTPAHAVGLVDVVVENSATSSGTLSNGYNYTIAGPVGGNTFWGIASGVATTEKVFLQGIAWDAGAGASPGDQLILHDENANEIHKLTVTSTKRNFFVPVYGSRMIKGITIDTIDAGSVYIYVK